jgi:hypothetical protein
MNTFQRLCALCILAFVAFGQSEQLKLSETPSVSISKARPGVEELRGASDLPFEQLASLADDVLKSKLDGNAVADRLSRIANENPGHNYVSVVARHADGTPFYSHATHNLRTNAGTNWQGDLMGSTSTPSVNTQCNYIALTNDATAPAVTDTTLTSEIAANGLSRAQGTYARTNNSSTYTISKTFTATGTQSFQNAGMFTASSGGTMCFRTAVTSGTVNNTDTLTFTWTVNF